MQLSSVPKRLRIRIPREVLSPGEQETSSLVRNRLAVAHPDEVLAPSGNVGSPSARAHSCRTSNPAISSANQTTGPNMGPIIACIPRPTNSAGRRVRRTANQSGENLLCGRGESNSHNRKITRT